MTVWAHGLLRKPSTAVRPHPAAWYGKHRPTFNDAICSRPPGLVVATEFFRVPGWFQEHRNPAHFAESILYVPPPEIAESRAEHEILSHNLPNAGSVCRSCIVTIGMRACTSPRDLRGVLGAYPVGTLSL